jgi:hypothetical protein
MRLSEFDGVRSNSFVFVWSDLRRARGIPVSSPNIRLSRFVLMSRSSCATRLQRTKRLIFVSVCSALLLATGIIQAVHCHGLNDTPHPDCSLCVAVHSAVARSAPIALPVVVTEAREIEVSSPSSPRYCVLLDLYIRPPPVGPSFA